MKFVKLENGNVDLTDNSGNVFQFIQDIGVRVQIVGSSAIQILQDGYPVFGVAAVDVAATQVLPAAEVPFAGSNTDLAALLSEFFFVVDSGGIVGPIDVNVISPNPLPVVFSAEDLGEPFAIDRGTTPLITGNVSTLRALFAIRLNVSFPGSIVSLRDFTIMCTSTSAYNVQVILNPTISGGALVWTALSGSSIDFDATKTNATTVTGGTVLRSFSAAQRNQGGQFEGDLSDIKLTGSDIIVIAVRRLTGANETFYGSLNFNDKQ